jgi:hypothetical protein
VTEAATAPDLVTVQDYTAAIEAKLQTKPAALDHNAQQVKFRELVQLYLRRAGRLEDLAVLAESTTSAEVAAVLRVLGERDVKEAEAWHRHSRGVAKQRRRTRPKR